MNEQKRIIVHNKSNLPTIVYSKLKRLQGDFKILSEESLEKLIKSIEVYGFLYPAFIWKSNGVSYIVDCHSRQRALAVLESRGFFIPEIPYVEIPAIDKKDAIEKLLHLKSTYSN